MLKLVNLMAIVLSILLLAVVIFLLRELCLALLRRSRERDDPPAGPRWPAGAPQGSPAPGNGAPGKGAHAATPVKEHPASRPPDRGGPPPLREPSRTLPPLGRSKDTGGATAAREETSTWEDQRPAPPITTPRKSLPALPRDGRTDGHDAPAGREPAVRAEVSRVEPSRPRALPPRQREDGAEVWLHGAAATSAGRHRRRNEDFHFADTDLLVVADGVGGAPAGEVASQLAVEAVVRAWRRTAQHTHHHLQGGFRDANAAVLQHVKGNPRLRGMATTLDACAVIGDRIVGAHVGDGYVWAVPPERTTVEQITKPHSAPQGPLLRMIGSSVPARPDLWAITARPDTRLVLASDGLPADLDKRELRRLILSTADMAPTDAASHLLKAALKAGGTDNVTVIVADVVLSGLIDQARLFVE
ncbi:protein phosphatase 2C domain-containing protein [Streptomyces sp. NPDC088785]|uniref:PP2C family protein-serine/threonine phosphatase n=1 Tax=Streptomyces sp. NPDC088785 TaxID=3365897 RepID=UPI003811DCBB